MCKRGRTCAHFGSTLLYVVVAHFDRRKRSEAAFGSKDNQRYCGNTILVPGSLVASLIYHRYLRTLFAIYIDRKIASQLQSCASVLAKRASLVNTMTPDQDLQPYDRQGGDAANTAKRWSIAMATPRMFAPDPSTRASLASLVVGTGTAGTVAEMSPTFAGGYHHGEVGGGNGGSIPIKESGICQ